VGKSVDESGGSENFANSKAMKKKKNQAE